MLLQFMKDHHSHETELIAAIQKHAEDEKKHYFMFCHYFKSQKKLPYKLNEKLGYSELLIQKILKLPMKEVRPEKFKKSPSLLIEIFKIIALTEKRGLKQVNQLLKSPLIQNNKTVLQIFKVIQIDEPSHYLPYEKWLLKNNQKPNHLSHQILEHLTHYELILAKIPSLFLNLRLKKDHLFNTKTNHSAITQM